jgi:peptidoglycan/LPS O-acetylase OafA/YrhL
VESRRSIPSLDGLRALSVCAVILGHSQSLFLDRIPFNASFRNGSQGVIVFFGISGFLITHLLLKELRGTGGINLKRFYLRRTLRIFPPFYIFLLMIGTLNLFHRVHVSTGDMIAAATYSWNYFPLKEGGWLLAHCWSLTLEEQFYLLWPLSMKSFTLQANVGIASGVILLSPLSRIVTYYAWPSMRGHMAMMLHTHLDAIMTGCLLALIVDLNIWQRFRTFALHSAAPVAAILFLLLVDTPACDRWAGRYLLPVGFSLQNFAVAILLLYCVFRSESFLGKFLNLKILRHLGTISYGLYLWQQAFTGADTRWFPLNVLCIVACAELSFFLVERPSARLRDLIEHEWIHGRLRLAGRYRKPELLEVKRFRS